jgi:hypothetical protein
MYSLRRLFALIFLCASCMQLTNASSLNIPSKKEETSKRVVLDVDLSKGNAGKGVVTGGKFVPEGWTPVNPTDNITWTNVPFIPIKSGYISIEITNLDAFQQPLYNKNQFITFTDHENQAIAHSIGIRMSKVAKFFGVEVKERDGTNDDWREWKIEPDEQFDLKKTYRFTIQWDGQANVEVLFNKQSFKHPNNRTLAPVIIKGLHQLIIGDNWTKGASPGPIYKRITCVSLDGEKINASLKGSSLTNSSIASNVWQTVNKNQKAIITDEGKQILNVARVKSSSQIQIWPGPSYSPINACDGKEMSSRWLTENSTPQWITFDLGQVKTIEKLKASFDRYRRISYTFSLSISQDNRKWIDLIKESKSEKKEWMEIPIPATKARYVKLTIHNSDASDKLAGLWEVYILGN